MLYGCSVDDTSLPDACKHNERDCTGTTLESRHLGMYNNETEISRPRKIDGVITCCDKHQRIVLDVSNNNGPYTLSKYCSGMSPSMAPLNMVAIRARRVARE